MTQPLPPHLQEAANAQKSRNYGMEPEEGYALPASTTPFPTDRVQLSDEKVKREEATSTSDYLGSMWRQDSPVDGLVAHFVGKQFVEQEGYTPFLDPEFAQAQKEVDPSLIHELYDARSPAHLLYTKSRLIDKQRDLERLGDLGWKGNVGRIALGFADPANLATGMTGGLIYKGVHAYRMSRAAAAVRATTGSAQLRAADAAMGVATKAPSVLAGAAGAAIEGAAFERIRQNVNFEDSYAAVADAALFSALLSVPFIAAGSRAQRRASAAINDEREALRALADLHDGRELSEAQKKVLVDTYDRIGLLKQVEAGEVTPDQFIEMDQAYLARHGLLTADEHIELAGTATRPRVRTDAETPHQGGLEVTEGSLDEIEMDAPHQGGLEVTEQPVAENIDVRDSTWEDFWRTREGEPPANTAMADKLRDALGVKAEKDAATAARDAEIGELLRAKMAKDEAFATAEADAAAAKDRDLTAMQAEAELARAAAPTNATPTTQEALEARVLARDGERREVVLKDGTRVTLSFSAGDNPGARTIRAALADGTEVAVVSPVFDIRPGRSFADSEVDSAFRRKGLGTAMYDFAEELSGVKLVQSGVASADAKAFWAARTAAEEAPAGFRARGSIGAGAVADIERTADNATRMRGVKFSYKGKEYELPTRLDFFATLNRSDLVSVRRLAFDLIKDPIQIDSKEAQGITASEHKSIIRRTIMGGFLSEAKEAFIEAAKVRGKRLWGRQGFSEEFYSLVTRATRGDLDVAAQNPDIAAHIQRAASAQKRMYQTFLEEMKKAGVKGADQVDLNEFYVNRVWRYDRIREAVGTHGKDRVVRLIANSVRDPELRGNVAEAAKFLDTIIALEHTPVMRDLGLHGKDMAYLRHELGEAGIAGDRVDDIVATLLKQDPRSDAGRAGNLKYRWDLDETLNDNGLRLSDLMENDARVLADLYSNSMAGHIGLAKVGIRGAEDWAVRLKEVTDEAGEKLSPNGERYLRYLKDVHANITGRPMSTQTFDPLSRVANATRGYTRGVMLGQLGFTAAWELRQAFALSTARAMFAHTSFLNIIEALRKGYVPDKQLSRDIRWFTGAGNELYMSYARQAEVHEFGMEMGLNAIEHWSNRVSHAADVVSGNRNVTSLTRNISAMAMLQKHVDWATGRKSLSAKQRERMVGQGIDDEMLDTVLEHLKEYTVRDSDGIALQLRYDDWKREHPETHDIYQGALTREFRDAIQDHDIGETMPWMHTALGKVIGELRTFFFVAHAKNMLKNLSYKDSTAFQVFAISYLGEMMAYSLQTAVNNAHDPEKLRKKLDPELIARAAFARSAALGLVPFLYGTGHELATGESFTRPGMTANTDSRSFLRTPSMMVAGRMAALPQAGADAVLGRTVTEQQVRDAWTALPLSNTWGMRSLVDWTASLQPKSKPPVGAD